MEAWPYIRRMTAEEVVRDRDLSDCNIVVTGATGRIGFAVAKALAGAGAAVTLAARGEDNGRHALSRLRDAGLGERANFRRLDLASLDQIDAFCDGLAHERLHALVCAVGLVLPCYQATADGLERNVGVSHFGQFYLFSKLWPRMRAAKSSRLVMISSSGHRFAKLRLDRFPPGRDRYNGIQAYCQAKAAHILMVRELERRYVGDGLVASANHPGVVLTGARQDLFLLSAVSQLFRPIVNRPSEGAAASVIGVAHEPAGEVSGQYLSGNRVAAAGGPAQDSQLAEDLWTFSEEKLADLGHPVA